MKTPAVRTLASVQQAAVYHDPRTTLISSKASAATVAKQNAKTLFKYIQITTNRLCDNINLAPWYDTIRPMLANQLAICFSVSPDLESATTIASTFLRSLLKTAETKNLLKELASRKTIDFHYRARPGITESGWVLPRLKGTTTATTKGVTHIIETNNKWPAE